MKHIVVMVQARVNSARLPRKVLKPLGSTSVLGFLLNRLKRCKSNIEVVVVTTDLFEDDAIVRETSRHGVASFRGSENDVLKRFLDCALAFQADIIVRVTADCPLIDPNMLDEMITLFLADENISFMSNQTPASFPDGFDIDIFTKELLVQANSLQGDDYSKEHVTPLMKRIVGEHLVNWPCARDLSSFRFTVDDSGDLEFLNCIVLKYVKSPDFGWEDVVQLVESDPNLRSLMIENVERSKSLPTSRGLKLFSRAKQVLGGGGSFLSKKPQMILPDQWPTYFSRAKGFQCWDLDGVRYEDFSLMGVGTNTLGFANDYVDQRVLEAVGKSNMSSLNPPEEVMLAERLLELHPWFSKAKFARTGAEINAMALRLGRASSGKTKVAICGYHGWHDWYLATNIANSDSLETYLLSGLSVDGVPKVLGSEILSFLYNDFESFNRAVSDEAVGVVFMEVMRSQPPLPGFLEHVREKTRQRGIVLIFDECSSGFRDTFGGVHSKEGIFPDMATFGKALGNGFAITALLGTEEVMSKADRTFLSSTFWSERIGFVAAVATLEEMERQESWKITSKIGAEMATQWTKVFKEEGLEFTIQGQNSAISYTLPKTGNLLRTYITQEMLRRFSIFSTPLFYASTSHSIKDIEAFGEKFHCVVKDGVDLSNKGLLESALLGPQVHSSFGRLT